MVGTNFSSVDIVIVEENFCANIIGHAHNFGQNHCFGFTTDASTTINQSYFQGNKFNWSPSKLDDRGHRDRGS